MGLQPGSYDLLGTINERQVRNVVNLRTVGAFQVSLREDVMELIRAGHPICSTRSSNPNPNPLPRLHGTLEHRLKQRAATIPTDKVIGCDLQPTDLLTDPVQ